MRDSITRCCGSSPHRSILIQPLRVRGEIAGMFAFIWTRARHRFNDVELRLVDAVTQQAGIAIENAELLTEVRDFTTLLEQRVRDRTTQLKRTNEELRTSKEELRALTTHIEGVRESERSRIACEIHDELGQALTALKIDLARLYGQEAGEHGGNTAALSTAIDEMIGTVRRISCELRPRILDDLGLQAALEWQAQELERRTGVKCRFQCKGLPCEIDAERSTALFRIFQEITDEHHAPCRSVARVHHAHRRPHVDPVARARQRARDSSRAAAVSTTPGAAGDAGTRGKLRGPRHRCRRSRHGHDRARAHSDAARQRQRQEGVDRC